MKPKVVVLGGGVAGMSAAHELVERDFQVVVLERQGIPGGKARSIRVVEPFARPTLGGRSFSGPRYRSKNPWLPGEHGFRFFPGFYRHIIDTMARIPNGNGKVVDHLVDTTECHHARFGKKPVIIPVRFPRTPRDFKNAVLLAVDWLGGQLEVTPEETAFFSEKLWQLMTSCDERRLEEYEKTYWWDFIEAEERSPAYQKLFANAITRSLVAAKAERASTRTIGKIFIQILIDVLDPSVSTADRVLDGPTNEVWIDPWLEYLRARGVEYHFETDVRAIHLRDGRVHGVSIEKDGRASEVVADYFVAALPVERMAELVTPALAEAEPALGKLAELAENVEWMNGIQFYLKKDVPLAHGHSIYVDTPWALTSVSQAQFWPNVDLSQYGDGTIRGILSVDISDWDVPGLNGKCAEMCTRDEIAAETWLQLKKSLNVDGVDVLRDEDLHSWFLDPDIVDLDPARPGIELNREPLLVNYWDTWSIRPEASTKIPNLFLASDYVRTHTDLATMEAANEAARRAVNGLLDASGSRHARCEIWPLHEPPVLAPLRAYDRLRFQQGLPWDPKVALATDAARNLLSLLESVSENELAGPELKQRLLRDLSSLVAAAAGAAENTAPAVERLATPAIRIVPL
ncbi:MAG TPA: FAD-dependent oxidoreductase [Polyangiaceae bacterium]